MRRTEKHVTNCSLMFVVLAAASACGSQSPSFTQKTLRAQETLDPAQGQEGDRMGQGPSANATVATGDYSSTEGFGQSPGTTQAPGQDSGEYPSPAAGGDTSSSSSGETSSNHSTETASSSEPNRLASTSDEADSIGSTIETSIGTEVTAPSGGGRQTGEPTTAENPAGTDTEGGNPTDPGSNVGSSPTPEDVTEETVAARCQSSERKSKVITLKFDEKPQGCAWNVYNNDAPLDGHVWARHEDVIALELGSNETICELAITSEAQSISFDDSLLLTFNDVILMSSYDYTPEFASKDGLFQYSWPDLKGAYNPGPADDDTTYCLGAGEGEGAACDVPATQTEGTFFLTMPHARSHQLSALAIQEQRADLSLIVTGDNDLTDCRRSELTLEVEISYVGGSH